MRVVVIGTGFGERVVAPTYRKLGAEVVVVSPRDGAGIAEACDDVDLVSVHSPPFLHHDHVMVALERCRAVLCDKPFGRDAAEARAMRDRAVEAGVLHFLNFEFRRLPARQQVKQLVVDGAIGDLVHISHVMIGSGLRRQQHRWLFDRSLAGGWVGAYGSHAIDMLRWFFDAEVAECGGVLRTETTSRPGRDGGEEASTAEDAFSAWFVMANGMTASIDTAFSASVNLPRRVILMGSTGSVELVDERTVVLRRPREADEIFDYEPPPGDPHEPALEPWLKDVLDAVRTGQQLRPCFDDGVAVAEVMDRLRALPA